MPYRFLGPFEGTKYSVRVVRHIECRILNRTPHSQSGIVNEEEMLYLVISLYSLEPALEYIGGGKHSVFLEERRWKLTPVKMY
jgi:hypothetical protein